MFGGIGGAIKNFGEKAEGILEEQKKKVEELAIEKKNAAAALLESQKEKIGEMLWQTKTEEGASTSEGTKAALAGFEEELGKKAEQTIDDSLQQVSATVDVKLKETEEFLDGKRDEVSKSLTSGAESVTNPASSVLGKAKGFLNL